MSAWFTNLPREKSKEKSKECASAHQPKGHSLARGLPVTV